MKRIFARIGMYLTVSDEEFEELKKEYYGEKELARELVKRFISQNEPAFSPYAESYVPDSVFEEPESCEVKEEDLAIFSKARVIDDMTDVLVRSGLAVRGKHYEVEGDMNIWKNEYLDPIQDKFLGVLDLLENGAEE